uniref:protein-tyrosine-phosphatase n=1 Tax=Timema douglasi TaxID=61478 RepID=A0A7R8VVG7_TIMDO|nr:unnamed protein product [Timema douglasi]
MSGTPGEYSRDSGDTATRPLEGNLSGTPVEYSRDSGERATRPLEGQGDPGSHYSSEDYDEDWPSSGEMEEYPIDFDELVPQQYLAIGDLPGYRYKTTRRNLHQDLGVLKRASISHVCCLCTSGELAKYRVPQLIDEYKKCGLSVFHLPIPDGDPPSIPVATALIENIKCALDSQHKVLVHCFGGLGRAAVIVACYLMTLDRQLEPETVIELIRQTRGARAIQTVKLEHFSSRPRNGPLIAPYMSPQLSHDYILSYETVTTLSRHSQGIQHSAADVLLGAPWCPPLNMSFKYED